MKKKLSKILILFIIFANLFAPLSVGLSKNNNIEVKNNIAHAEDGGIKLTVVPEKNNTEIRVNVTVNWSTMDGTTEGIKVTLKDSAGVKIKDEIIELTGSTINQTGNTIQTGVTKTFTGLNPNTNYQITTDARQIGRLQIGLTQGIIWNFNNLWDEGADYQQGLAEKSLFEVITNSSVTTADVTSQNFVKQETVVSENAQSAAGSLPVCVTGLASIDIGGCIAQGLYYLFFKPTSFVFGLAGKALDFTIFYSINDTSYRSSFVVEGWGIVRDFCNMFFIFVLLYIAFGTILNLHSVKTKEMIIDVVIIGLLINFSLFATQVIIDSSNILTRVFYNQKTIITGAVQKDASGNPLPVKSELGAFGEIKLSEAIVSKVDPQQLVMRASEVESIGIKGTAGNEDSNKTTGGISTGTFIIVVLLASAVNVVGTIAFLSSALIFIGRVVMLWLAMILAPLAFFSYIVPQLQDIEMIGWKKWWPDTLKMAFVAPVFAFFMYIIVGFMDKGLGIVNASFKTGAYGLNFVISIMVPFAFIMILLMKAKSIAVKMSGEVGAAMSKAGAAVGGIALGAATGGAAFALRGTLGAAGEKLSNQAWTKNTGAFGRMASGAGKWTASKTFDARNTDLGKKAAKGMGIEGDIGKAKEGGYTKYKADVQKKREETAKSLEVGHDEELMHDLHSAQEAAQKLKNEKSKDIDALTGKIPVAQQDSIDKTNRANNLKVNAELDGASQTDKDAYANARDEATKASDRVRRLKEDKANISDGGMVMEIDPATNEVRRDTQGNPIPDGSGKYHTTNGNITQKGFDKAVADEAADATAAAGAAAVRVTAIADAGTAETTAITAAGNAKIAAEQKALADETSAIQQASTVAANAAVIAREAREKALADPTDTALATAAENAEIASNNAMTRLQTTTAQAETTRIAAVTKAGTDAGDAIIKAGLAKTAALTKADTDKTAATTKAAASTAIAADARTSASRGVGSSISKLDFEVIPDANHKISTENSRRKNVYAEETENRWFNKSANKHAAHNIRMGAEIKSDGKGGH